MENRQVRELMSAMGRSGIKKLRIRKGDWEIEIEREGFSHSCPEEAREMTGTESRGASAGAKTKSPLAQESKVPEHAKGGKGSSEGADDAHCAFVTSPMVGVFYPTPSPDHPPFVKEGDRVSPDTVVCIIEAMKVMNEVKAGVSGVVKETLVEKGHPVEFGSKLFKIVPSA